MSIVNGQEIDKLPYKTSWLNLEQMASHDMSILIPAIQLEIISFKNNLAFMLRLPSRTFGGGMEGICGNCNGDQNDDFKTRNGKVLT